MALVRIDQHPLAYLLGLQGLALMRAFSGEHDRAFTEARIAEIRELLDHPPAGRGGGADEIGTLEGYADWAPTYDRPGNALIDAEEPIVRSLVSALPAGDALDAACGTGRHTAFLASRGHRVIGVDSSADMLARVDVPGAELCLGSLERLPLAAASVDLVVCGLALSHCPSLPPVFAEFARVLRPGGRLIVSDTRGLPGTSSYPMGRAPGVMMARAHPTSAYLAAALPLGLQVLACFEPPRSPSYTRSDSRGGPPREDLPPSIWELHQFAPVAAAAAYEKTPAVIVLEFQMPGPLGPGRPMS
jgi:ubiquinone/menaquinone biosynthesis C-methylase UbiE